jgi:hypothetical protein
LSYLMAPRPARLPNPKPTTINPKDSRYERGTTGGQVSFDPNETVVIDDSVSGVLAGRRAGMLCGALRAAGIPTAHLHLVWLRPVLNGYAAQWMR